MSNDWYRVGHVTKSDARTGCTVIIFDEQVPAAVDVRGGAPGTRETTLLGPGRRGHVDAVVLSGGSAFGLSVADGVMSYLVDHGRGLPTPAGPVPLVPAAIIFDLAVGERTFPTAEWGRSAAEGATRPDFQVGAIGAGTGATVAKAGGDPSPSGIGWGFAASAAGEVAATVVLNAVGDVIDPSTGQARRAAADPEGQGRSGAELIRDGRAGGREGENTTIGCIMIDAPLDGFALARAAIAAHDGLARAVHPAHTPFDGDTFFVVARRSGTPDIRDVASLCVATTEAVENAILSIFDQDAATANRELTPPTA